MLQGDATEQTPPDLPSFLFKERIVYLVGYALLQSCNNAEQSLPFHHVRIDLKAQLSVQGMALVPAVTELMLAELMYLQYDNPTKPIFMYINSAGVQVRG